MWTHRPFGVGMGSDLLQSRAKTDDGQSVAILAQAISCSNVHGAFLVHESFWFCLVQMSTTQFCSFSPVFMANVDDGPICLSLLCLVLLRILVLLMVLALISKEWVTAQSMHSSKTSEIFCYHSRVDSQILTTKSRPSVKPWVWSPPELPVLNRPSMPSLPRWPRLQHCNRTSIPFAESVISLTARMCKIETSNVRLQWFRLGKIMEHTWT